MIGLGPAMVALIVVGFPIIALTFLLSRWFKLKERRLELEVNLAAEKAPQYATSNKELEQRVRVLEQIATDRGAETASQIEALRAPRLMTKEENRA